MAADDRIVDGTFDGELFTFHVGASKQLISVHSTVVSRFSKAF